MKKFLAILVLGISLCFVGCNAVDVKVNNKACCIKCKDCCGCKDGKACVCAEKAQCDCCCCKCK